MHSWGAIRCTVGRHGSRSIPWRRGSAGALTHRRVRRRGSQAVRQLILSDAAARRGANQEAREQGRQCRGMLQEAAARRRLNPTCHGIRQAGYGSCSIRAPAPEGICFGPGARPPVRAPAMTMDARRGDAAARQLLHTACAKPLGIVWSRRPRERCVNSRQQREEQGSACGGVCRAGGRPAAEQPRV